MKRVYKYLVGDFETTVFKGQTYTEVWASAIVEMGTEDVNIFHSIGETWEYLKALNQNLIIYYHNLKFDGSFWLNFFLNDAGLKQAVIKDEKTETVEFIDRKDMKNNTFKYSISNMGQWYSITVKIKGKYIEIRDSLKLLPFSVKRIGTSFGTKHKKLDMEYEGLRYAGCPITEEEQAYIANDVLVVKEALEIMFSEGHKNLTIGSCCLSEYKRLTGRTVYEEQFPNIYEIPIDETYGATNAGEYVKKSYHGGWCYLVEEKKEKLLTNGTTADVNSLYSSMMSSESGNRYPVGKPLFWKGDYIPEVIERENYYYFVRIRTRFELKPGYLPFIQIKGNPLYKGTECLKTSDILDPETGGYIRYIETENGVEEHKVTLTLTMTDFALIKEHYNLTGIEILDGCYFASEIGIFDDYIEKYKKIKLENKGAKRELGKLFLNNLYGKLATSPNSSFKYCFLNPDNALSFVTIDEHNKTPVYIPAGSAVTSYARNFTIRAAQANFHGVDKPGFTYSDTDSIHCDLPAEEITGIKIHDKNFCCWKLESGWDYGWFVRQKTYIEHIVSEDGKKIEHPFYNVKCAGMPKRSKDLFIKSMTGEGDLGELTLEESDFIKVKRKLTDFKIGLRVPGKLLPRQIKGGVVLTPTSYEMR